LFATSLRLATRSTADTLPHLNRAAADPSDVSARIGRPGASSSVTDNVILICLLCSHLWIEDFALWAQQTEEVRSPSNQLFFFSTLLFRDDIKKIL
jgi:hypothetical protein